MGFCTAVKIEYEGGESPTEIGGRKTVAPAVYVSRSCWKTRSYQDRQIFRDQGDRDLKVSERDRKFFVSRNRRLTFSAYKYANDRAPTFPIRLSSEMGYARCGRRSARYR